MTEALNTLPVVYKNAITIYEIAPLDTPDAFVRLGHKIVTIENAPNDITKDEGYYDGDGTAETIVESTRQGYNVTGYRAYGDPAQDMIAKMADETGNARKIILRQTFPDGTIKTGRATVSAIVETGGDATAEATFSCTITRDERPEVTEAEETI